MSRSKIVITGRGGSGKDYMRKLFENKGFKHCVSCTSRPPRPGEIEGVDYKFVSKEFFDINKDLFYEIDDFNGWKYGTLKEDFENSDLFVMTPRGVTSLKKEDREKCLVVYINPGLKIIKQRLMQRKDADNAERRMQTDAMDFAQFTDYDIEINNIF